MNTAIITAALVVACQAILVDTHISGTERDAASLTIASYNEGNGLVDEHLAGVLMGYATRQSQQNRYGK